MIISLVNFSKESDADVQVVIRAINRQISQDFEPYWHIGAQLRLEGQVGGKPMPQSPAALMRNCASLVLVQFASAVLPSTIDKQGFACKAAFDARGHKTRKPDEVQHHDEAAHCDRTRVGTVHGDDDRRSARVEPDSG